MHLLLYQNRIRASFLYELKYQILNTKIDNLDMQETLAMVDYTISKGNQLHHVVVNAGKIVAMQDDLQLRKSVNESDLINADGQAVVWASRFLGKQLKERVAGIDLMVNLVQMAYENRGLVLWKVHGIFLFRQATLISFLKLWILQLRLIL